MDIQQNQVSEEVQETAAPAKKGSVGRVVLLAFVTLFVILGTIVRPPFVTLYATLVSPAFVFLGLFAAAGIIAVIVSMFLNEKVGKLVKVIGLAATALGFLFLTIAGFQTSAFLAAESSAYGILYGSALMYLFACLMFAAGAVKVQFGINLNVVIILCIVFGAICLSISYVWEIYMMAGSESFVFFFSASIMIAEFVLLFIAAKKLSK